MKRKQWIIYFLFFSFSFGPLVCAASTPDGQLQINPNIITNKEGGIGNTSDFPIQGQLFSEDLNHAVEEKEKAGNQILQEKSALTFGSSQKSPLYKTDTSQVLQGLFTNYKPQVVGRTKNESQDQGKLAGYGIMIVIGFLLFFGAIFLGRGRGKKRMKGRVKQTSGDTYSY